MPSPPGYYFQDGKYFVVTKKLYWPPKADTKYTKTRLEIPKGFVTDWASVPWYARFFINETGPHGAPAVVHDYLYWEQLCTRDQADEIFNIAMKEQKVVSFWRWAINLGVACCAESAWNDNAGEREDGMARFVPEDRVDAECTQEPSTPNLGCTETWPEYRVRLRQNPHVKIPEKRTGEELAPDYCKLENYSHLTQTGHTKSLAP